MLLNPFAYWGLVGSKGICYRIRVWGLSFGVSREYKWDSIPVFAAKPH